MRYHAFELLIAPRCKKTASHMLKAPYEMSISKRRQVKKA